MKFANVPDWHVAMDEIGSGTPLSKPTMTARLKDCDALHKTFDFYDRFARANNVSVCIAGGAIRDLVLLGDERAVKDYDVWFMEIDLKDSVLIMTLEKRLMDQYIAEEIIPAHKSEKFVHPAKRSRIYGFNSYMSHTVAMPWMRKLHHQPWAPNADRLRQLSQVMFTPYTRPDELTDTFDWKNCRFSWDGETVDVEGLQHFYDHQLALNHDEGMKLPIPMHTLHRGFYLEEKYKYTPYGVVVDKQDAAFLGALVLHGRKDGAA